MKLNRRKKSLFQDSSASSDIAFLLIIYFIVIAGFNVNKGFLMTLPQKNSARLILKEDLLRFELDADGVIQYQGEPLTWDTAEREIRGMIRLHPNLAVAVSVSPRAPWQEVVSFVGLAQKLQVESFSFSLNPDAGGAP